MQCLRKSVLHEGLINDGFAYQCRNVTSKKKDTEIFKKDFFVSFDSLKKKFYFVYNEKKNQQKNGLKGIHTDVESNNRITNHAIKAF